MNPAAIDALRRRFDQEVPPCRRNADIALYRDFVARHDQLISAPEVAKDDGMAIRCRQAGTIGSKPFDLDFPNPDPLDAFKVLHHAIPNRNRTMEHLLKLSVAAFQLVFLKNPLVASMFYTAAHRNAMLRCLLLHGRVCSSLALNQEDDRGGWLGALSPIATLVNHSCDPNAAAFVDSGTIKIAVLRPIQRGDQISIAYPPVWWNAHDGSEQAFLCKCAVCGPDGAQWHEAHQQMSPISPEAKRELSEKIEEQIPLCEKFQHMVQILARDGHHPGEMFGEVVKRYHDLLAEEVRQRSEQSDRARLMLRVKTLPPVASLINHSCDPNVISVVDSGSIKIIVLRPIQKGDQILTSYAPAWWDEHDGSTLDFDCKCVVCDRGPEGAKWRNAREKKRILSSEATREWIGGGETQDLIKFQRLVQILARDGHHPGKLFGETVKIYYDKLFDEVCAENAKRNRAKVQQIGGN
ncbi:hypothetical protein pipiens_007374 [Culex pipiens pipiens]|uniref:SET domain-containing protein n=1 Tax=Culex pipiens pipiens TaxID=38569 RepID=A0ABD1DM80_CULPP